MVSSTIAKLYSTTMEKKVSAWAESQNKQALGQASFRPNHSPVDHLVTLKSNYGRKSAIRKNTTLLFC